MKWGRLETWRPKIAIPSRILALQIKLVDFCSSKARPPRTSKEALLALEGDNEHSFLSAASSPDRRRDVVYNKGRMEKGVLFCFSSRSSGWGKLRGVGSDSGTRLP